MNSAYDERWHTTRERVFGGRWLAVYPGADGDAWHTGPVDGLVLQLHPDHRSRILAALRDDVGRLVPLDPQPFTCVPTDKLRKRLASMHPPIAEEHPDA
ncbi:hypothetical protein [Mycobacterium montefiorense]|uniref:Uncharacterized protein n=1 Tax=Mycobacterium montefiorense TaxID=154654 RepID=A0AA37V2I3_9MYCO|nr:hypothetical protein [Mycobacterium montefiorense]GBG35823.1 hypothetical protein MmonteBS_01950 [Mycobacterium montefiorense]GKU35973.1 hypothetical protein NJB14191_33190 [Mycobacterium montefiorense]GKU41579.1 hypothetical protein NJB14192_35630 [Mycobacterium montefiorense]GKU44413.1 hypothetical protein NJB14194_10410 [Mycobacterium montefiorense]GKU51917.1 hypothetical protein NJB14195_31610 [Mycobacterium montefiorense]